MDFESAVFESPPSSTKLRFDRVFINLGSVMAAISFASFWIGTFYLNLPTSSIIGFQWQDWVEGCPSALNGIGIHCFSDYYTPSQAFRMVNPWENGYAYTPLAAQIFYPFYLLGEVFNSPRVGLITYLAIGSLCVLIPTIWASRRSAEFSFPTLVIFGVFATPLVNAFDRGSVVMFMTPLLFIYAVNICRQKWNIALIAAVVLSAAKPQYVVLLLPFLVHRKWFLLQRGLRWTIGLNVLGFIAFTSEPILVFKQWFNFALAYNNVNQLDTAQRANISPIPLISEILNTPLKLGEHFLHIQLNLSSIQTVVLVTSALVLPLVVIGKQTNLFGLTVISMVISSIFIPTSNYYYQVFAPVIAALIIRNPQLTISDNGGMLDSHIFTSKIGGAAKWIILIATLNSCFNIAISDNLLPFMTYESLGPGNVSRVFVGPFWVIAMVFVVTDTVLTYRGSRAN
jgi:hypothetical protein